jgi:Hypothetical glycosyl hydrolase family 15
VDVITTPARFKCLAASIALASTFGGCGKNLSVGPQGPNGAYDAVSPGLATRRDQFPSTPSGIHLNLVFNYGVKDLRREIGLVDVVWGASSSYPKQIYNQFYTPFERDGPYGGPSEGHTLAWWKRNHPDWIEYRCDRRHAAYEYGEPDVPIDTANPAVQAYQRTSAVDPALTAGYPGIAFDNLALGNYALRCGHFTTSGKWVQQYSGRYSDPRFTNYVIAWAKSTFAYIHGYSATGTMAINFSYDKGFSRLLNDELSKQTDELFDESGFTNWGTKGQNVTTPRKWRDIVGLIRAVQANNGCYMENGEEPALSKDITQAERLWVVANYLLTRDDCTYVYISGFTRSGAQDYGRLLLYPEYDLAVGKPVDLAKSVRGAWQRVYTGGLALVNPSEHSVTIALQGTYVDENGRRYSRSITLAKTSGEILLKQ